MSEPQYKDNFDTADDEREFFTAVEFDNATRIQEECLYNE